ncbi:MULTISPECIES: phage tail protein [Yersinia pseudotuberculosis complex]|uniref:phage tail protein n=1 Tax=Yersinia pseudotuberculosis complex TaxID=1649845 RepID=UPI0004F7C63D|nr:MULTISPECIES: phage tail protein [Yersinia pseudotuberculosis complex]AIN14265.1 phage P2 GpU family protein [Yersinia pseudotuberculosis]MBO1548751.1 hypothetical protein [Yersinia pseudotuberculosis]MBO1561855.1 hypothetical protein [Yersinia pseudotuberculosis]MBO1568970.1 hypothetical protein [Yersinia pseudotuberculosis]MBO1583701.1 hypothetical protein [Yersinia pseudotuberculosis]
MKPWAILGDIEFELLASPEMFDLQETTDWAEHALIRGKPILEYTGEALDELTIQARIHNQLVSPSAKILALRAARKVHQPMSLVLGDGDYRGVWVLADMRVSAQKTTPGGRILSAIINLTLREWTGEFSPPAPADGLLGGVIIDAGGLPDRVNTTQQLLAYAQTAGNVLNTGMNLYETIQQNPASALGELANLMSLTRQALDPLQQFAEVATLLGEGIGLVEAASGAVDELSMAVDALTNTALGAIFNRIDIAASNMGQAVALMDSVSGQLLALSAKTATRRA